MQGRKPGLSQPLEGKSVLVTGGAGAIGTNLVATLNHSAVGRTVILDNLSSAFEWNIPKGPGIRLVRGDVLDDDSLKEVFGERPKIVYHLAAQSTVMDAIEDPDYSFTTNVCGTYNVLSAIEYARQRRLGHVYLGYRVEGCASLQYKGRFQPQERLRGRVDGLDPARWERA